MSGLEDASVRAKKFFEYLFRGIIRQKEYRDGGLPILKEWERKIQLEYGGSN